MVSVIIPLYNTAKLISRCLDSVLRQSCNDIEIIVVDDCSTDGSAAVVERYCGQYPNIRLIRHDRNSGPMTSRRDGYEAATGDYLMFVDSDDVLPQDAVAGLLSRQQATDADIVFGNVLTHELDGTSEVTLGIRPQSEATELTKLDVVSAMIESRVRPEMWGKIYKRKLFADGSLQAFDGMTCAEDLCLIYQLVDKAEKIVTYDGVAYEYCRREDSLAVDNVYGEKELEDSIVAYKMMKTAFCHYRELHERLERRLTYLAFRLYTDTVGVGIATVRRRLRKHGMLQYGSLRYAVKYLGVRYSYFFAKRYLLVHKRLRK